MEKRLIGIYGFCFTKEILYKTFKLIPFYKNKNEVKKISKDEGKYYLTGLLEIASPTWNEDVQFDIEGVLTFVQKQDVLLRNEFEKTKLSTINLIEEFIETYSKRRRYDNDFLAFDKSHELKSTVIGKLYEKLRDGEDKNNESFRRLVFKSIEEWRMKSNYIEVTYYLLFSGLEAFAKSYLCHEKYSGDVVPVLAEFLDKLGIDFISEKDEDSKVEHNLFNRYKKNEEIFYAFCLRTYSTLRNALFHKNKFTTKAILKLSKNKKIKFSIPTEKEVSISDYEYRLRNLVNLVILKYIEVSDEHIKWDDWADKVGCMI